MSDISHRALGNGGAPEAGGSAPVLHVNGLAKRFGDTYAVQEVGFTLHEGELVTLLGPSGCGKTTTLRCITGSLTPDSGTIVINGVDVTRKASHVRNVGQIFQNFALFPHLTVMDNVAFPLKVRKVAAAERRRAAGHMLETVRLSQYADRYPRELSGGQQQRVGLARALVYQPPLVLFDEPLSNLDAKLRLEMRYEILRLRSEFKFSAVYVTHDQDEALSLSDRIVVMNHGVVHQIGTPFDIYENPRTAFVAEFVGNPNVFKGTVDHVEGDLVSLRLGNISIEGLACSAGLTRGSEAVGFIRPERLTMAAGASHSQSEQDIPASIVGTSYLGNRTECLVDVQGFQWRITASNGVEATRWDAPTLRLRRPDCRVYAL